MKPMTADIIAFISSTVIAFYVHQWGERFLTRGGKKKIKLIFRGYQIHHSFWGAMAIFLAPAAASGALATMLVGYGLGNIWQHKKTHNAVNEKGIVFVTKILR